MEGHWILLLEVPTGACGKCDDCIVMNDWLTAGVQMVLVFLVILTSGLQFLVQKVNYRRDLEKVRQTMRDARLAAWGPKMVPLEGKRKVSYFGKRSQRGLERSAMYITGQSEPGWWATN